MATARAHQEQPKRVARPAPEYAVEDGTVERDVNGLPLQVEILETRLRQLDEEIGELSGALGLITRDESIAAALAESDPTSVDIRAPLTRHVARLADDAMHLVDRVRWLRLTLDL